MEYAELGLLDLLDLRNLSYQGDFPQICEVPREDDVCFHPYEDVRLQAFLPEIQAIVIIINVICTYR